MFPDMSLPPVILASASPRRKELLEQLGIKFAVVPSHAEEADTEMMTAVEIAQLNAYRKARAVAKNHPDALVIGVDTVVALGTRLFAKPADMADAERMILELSGKSHHVVSGVCMIHLRKHRQSLFADRTEVTFRSLNYAQIRRYLSLIKPLDKAGAYAIQDHGELIVERVDGSLTNVVGLPLARLEEELERFRVRAEKP